MTTPVPFFSVAAASQGVDLLASVSRVLRRHWYVLGEEGRSFEAAFAGYCGAAHCVGVANGTDALELALRALDVGAGDTVMLAANAGYYGSTAVRLVGATAHYVEIDAATMTLCTQALAAALEQTRPKAIIATHLYGQMAAIEAIAMLARMHGAALIEDCAQAPGARRGQRAGSFGDVGCFSFYPTKNLGALGDGGALTCRDEALAQRLRALRQYGWSQKYHNDLPGGRNSRLDEIQAAVLIDKLPTLDAANEQRRAVARYYQSQLAALPLQLPASVDDDFVAHLYVVRTAERDRLRAFLADAGIASEIHYPVPDHLQKVASSPAAALPETERACSSVLSLPCYPGMPGAHQQAVVSAMHGFFQR